MVRYTLLVLFSLFIYHSSVGQAKITVGPPYDVIDADSKYYFAYKGDIITLKVVKRSVVLQKLNAGTLKFQQTRLHDDFPKGYQIEKITRFKDRFYLFYSYWENEQEQLFAREIDIAGCSLKPAKKIITVNEKITGSLVRTGWMSAGVADKYDFYFSHDSTNMVVQYRVKPDKRDDSKSYDVIGM
ncbi:MAG TPA: hypothetical protein VGD31_15160, partial [Sphingobacteriaceae bacterium]